MKKFLILLVALLIGFGGPSLSWSQSPGVVCSGISAQLAPYDSEKVTVADSAIGFTSAKISPATGNIAVLAVVVTETSSIRYLDTGVNPTATDGVPVDAGGVVPVCGRTAVTQFRMIRSGAVSATAQIIYYRAR